MWQCPKCNCNVVNASKKCPVCYGLSGITVTNSNSITELDWFDHDIIKVQLHKLDTTIAWFPQIYKFFDRLSSASKTMPMTPEEEKFAKFYNSEKELVLKMDTLTLRAHIEELSDIAKEARARLTAAKDEDRERTARNKRESGQGFSTAIDADADTTDAINKVKKRQTKQEKILASLLAIPGIDLAQAQKMLAARNIKDAVDNNQELKRDNFRTSELTNKTSDKPWSNPFQATPAETTEKTEVKEITVDEENQVIVIEKTVTEQTKVNLPFNNPFSK